MCSPDRLGIFSDIYVRRACMKALFRRCVVRSRSRRQWKGMERNFHLFGQYIASYKSEEFGLQVYYLCSHSLYFINKQNNKYSYLEAQFRSPNSNYSNKQEVYYCVCLCKVINTLRTGSFKLFKRPLPGFLTILTL